MILRLRSNAVFLIFWLPEGRVRRRHDSVSLSSASASVFCAVTQFFVVVVFCCCFLEGTVGSPS